jgi:hypothetical protein
LHGKLAAPANPNTGAVDVITNWRWVELRQKAFEWSPLDDELWAWGRAGKKSDLKASIDAFAKDVGASGDENGIVFAGVGLGLGGEEPSITN